MNLGEPPWQKKWSYELYFQKNKNSHHVIGFFVMKMVIEDFLSVFFSIFDDDLVDFFASEFHGNLSQHDCLFDELYFKNCYKTAWPLSLWYDIDLSFYSFFMIWPKFLSPSFSKSPSLEQGEMWDVLESLEELKYLSMWLRLPRPDTTPLQRAS